MERISTKKAAWWIGGALLFGAAFAGLHKALKFEVDFDPWDEAYF